MNIPFLIFWLVAYLVSGPSWRRLAYHTLVGQRFAYQWLTIRSMDDFSYWQLLLLFVCNPVVLLNYGHIMAFLWCFFYGIALLFYVFVCYIIGLYLLLQFCYRFWYIAKLYNRGSIFRHTCFFARCYCRDLWEGHRLMPHVLQSYLLACVLWSSHLCILSESFQFATILVFVARMLLRGRHYGDFCRPASNCCAMRPYISYSDGYLARCISY